jgi:hypothetical protein
MPQDAAAELGAGQAGMVTQHPQQRGVRWDIHFQNLTIDLQSRHAPSPVPDRGVS